MTWTRASLPETHARAINNALRLDPHRDYIVVHRRTDEDVLRITVMPSAGPTTKEYEVSGKVWAEGPAAVCHYLRRAYGPLSGLPYAQPEADIPLKYSYGTMPTTAAVVEEMRVDRGPAPPCDTAYLLNPATMHYSEEIPMYTLNIQLTREDFAQGEEWVRDKVEAFLPIALEPVESGDVLYSDSERTAIEWYVGAVSPDGEKIIMSNAAGGTEEHTLGWVQDQILSGRLFQ
jgi:hypothetical protein